MQHRKKEEAVNLKKRMVNMNARHKVKAKERKEGQNVPVYFNAFLGSSPKLPYFKMYTQ